MEVAIHVVSSKHFSCYLTVGAAIVALDNKIYCVLALNKKSLNAWVAKYYAYLGVAYSLV